MEDSRRTIRFFELAPVIPGAFSFSGLDDSPAPKLLNVINKS